jgi:hypothetical protein
MQDVELAATPVPISAIDATMLQRLSFDRYDLALHLSSDNKGVG